MIARLGHEVFGSAVGATSGSGIGFKVAGPVGGMIGGVIGGALGKAVQAAREAGVENVQHLMTEALLNPDLFRVLMTKETRQNRDTLLNHLTTQLRRVSLVGAVQNSDPRREGRQWTSGPAAAPQAAMPIRNNLLSGSNNGAAVSRPVPQVNSLLQSAPPTSVDVTRPNLLYHPSQGGTTTLPPPPTITPSMPPTIAMPQRPPHAVMRGS